MGIRKVLIANRGEIAVRIIRTCRDMGISTVAVYSEADRGALHTRLADQSVCIGPAPAKASYLNIPNIISAAEITEAEAIHPGYGFLAENSKFAEVCRECGITFVGPSPEVIDMMGDKAAARETMQKAGVPVVPGSDGILRDFEHARELAESIGYPVLLKAAAGGGGKGMRLVWERAELEGAFRIARMEAKAAFDDDSLYMEKYIRRARHIEVQVLADAHGNAVHLGERDCTVQRRHQKLIEEAPSPVVDARLRETLGEYALKAVEAVGYVNAGTVEFIMDLDTNRIYFMEMNTRLQVEHPVTEVITGVDIVAEQLRIAGGERLSFHQDEIEFRGHAFEFRINAEDPRKDFAPSPGRLDRCVYPAGPWVRVDTYLSAGDAVLPFYDSLVAKLVVWGRDRKEALVRSTRALKELDIRGVATTAEFHARVVANPAFRGAEFSTRFIEEHMAEGRDGEEG